MKLKLKWKYAKGEFDTKTLKLIDIPARGIRGENDADICIKDGYNLCFATVHLGDCESSNALAKEIVRRWNEFPEELKR
jgi:hypothetical protein